MNIVRKTIARPAPILILAALGTATLPTPAAFAADGCPTGTFGISHAPDQTAHTVTFSNFVADAATPNLTCHQEVAAADGGYSLWRADYRGFANLDAGHSATFTAPDGAVAATGPYQDDVGLFDLRVATGPTDALTLDFAIDFVGPGAAPEFYANLETADYILLARTTQASVEASMAAIAESLAAALNQLRGTSHHLLLGGIGPFDAPDGVGAVASFGSAFFGITARTSPSESLSIFGGIGLVTQTAGTVDIGLSPLVAGAVRYILPGTGPGQIFVEAGLSGSPRLGLTISRPYENMGVMTEGIGTTTGSLLSLFGRAGIVHNVGAGELVLAATLSHDILNTAPYAEMATPENPFPANFGPQQIRTTAVAGSVAWTTPLGGGTALTLAADIGRRFGAVGITGDVVSNPVTGTAGNGWFANASARLGFQPTERLGADIFVLGMKTAGSPGELQVGGTLRLAF